MDDWNKDLFDFLDTVMVEVEQFFQEVGEVIETVATQVQQSVTEDIEQFLDDFEDFFEPIFIVYTELDALADDFEPPSGYKVEPTLDQNPACRECRHYHGRIYGGNLLICGMHPYGCEGSRCPDWEREEGTNS